jgi:hypothetical protein
MNRKHIINEKQSKCNYCGSTSKGKGCPYGPNNVHVHLNDPGRCIYCGSPSRGTGCPLNPTGNMHVHGIEFNNMIKETLNDGIVAGLLFKKLSDPVKKWPAYKLGLIDENGKIIKKPESIQEKSALTPIDLYVLRIKNMLGDHNVELLNNSSYLIDNKMDVNDIKLYTENYKNELDVKNKIEKTIFELFNIIADASLNGVKSKNIEKYILESIEKT